MNLADISPNSTIEDIVETFPDAVTYLLEKHQLRVICCGAPIWTTLSELAEKKAIDPETLCEGLRQFLANARAVP
jgi:hypothetical protein